MEAVSEKLSLRDKKKKKKKVFGEGANSRPVSQIVMLM